MSKTRDNIKNLIREQHGNKKRWTVYGLIDLVLIEPLPDNIDISLVINNLERTIPAYLVRNIDAIYVKHLKEFDERGINALYRDGAIFVTNRQDNLNDMLDDLVHEIAHAYEEDKGQLVYADGEIKREFMIKRKKLFDILRQEGYNIDLKQFAQTDYSKEFDNFLLRVVGYERLQHYTNGIFVKPYAVTSLREYFASCFEIFFLKDHNNYNILKRLSPKTYEKLLEIEEEE